jgi:hypothetical protein
MHSNTVMQRSEDVPVTAAAAATAAAAVAEVAGKMAAQGLARQEILKDEAEAAAAQAETKLKQVEANRHDADNEAPGITHNSCTGIVGSGKFKGQPCQTGYESPLNKADDRDFWCDAVKSCTLQTVSKSAASGPCAAARRKGGSTPFPCGLQETTKHAPWLSVIHSTLEQLQSISTADCPKVPSCLDAPSLLDAHKLKTNDVNLTRKFLEACMDPDPAAKELQAAIAGVLATNKIGVGASTLVVMSNGYAHCLHIACNVSWRH